MAIQSIQSARVAATTRDVQPKTAPTAERADFGKALNDVLKDVNTMQQQAGQSVTDLVAGNVENLHEVMIAMGKAQVSFQFMAQVRNKLLDAYREVMRMQV